MSIPTSSPRARRCCSWLADAALHVPRLPQVRPRTRRRRRRRAARRARQRARHPAAPGVARHRRRPTASRGFPPRSAPRPASSTLLVLTKANARSTVHRPTYLDYVGVKRYDAARQRDRRAPLPRPVHVVGVHRQPDRRPGAAAQGRRRSSTRAGFRPRATTTRISSQILESYPRDDLFQIDVDQLFDIAMGILRLQERRRVRLFVHREQYGRFVSCLVFVPRDRYTTPVRVRIADVLLDAFGATSYEWNTRLSASVLARLHYVLRVDPRVTRAHRRRRRRSRRASRPRPRAWADDLRDALVAAHGEEDGLDLLRVVERRVPRRRTRTTSPRPRRSPISPMLETLDATRRRARGRGSTVERRPPRPQALRPRRAAVALGGAARGSRTWAWSSTTSTRTRSRPPGSTPRWIKRFRLRGPAARRRPGRATTSSRRRSSRSSAGDAEDDVFNRLVLLAGLSWREVALLRAYSRYLRQVGTPFSQTYIADDARRAPRDRAPARRAVRRPPRPVRRPARAATTRPSALADEIRAELDAVTSLDEDRILRALLHLVLATLRTNWFQTDDDGQPAPVRRAEARSRARARPAAAPADVRDLRVLAARRRRAPARGHGSRGAASAGRTAAKTSAPRCSG